MKKTSLLLAATLATALPFAAAADDMVLNGQLNFKDVIGEQNVYVGVVAGDHEQTASAQGNAMEANVTGESYVDTYQINHSNVEADLNLEAGLIAGDAVTRSQSFTNSTTIEGDGEGELTVDNYQEANPHCESCYHDAKTYISAAGVGSLDSSTVAVANSFEARNGQGGMNVNSQQVNNSKISAVSNIYVGVAGNLSASSAAVGNTATFGSN